jgi:hypothetical protein
VKKGVRATFRHIPKKRETIDCRPLYDVLALALGHAHETMQAQALIIDRLVKRVDALEGRSAAIERASARTSLAEIPPAAVVSIHAVRQQRETVRERLSAKLSELADVGFGGLVN